MSPTNSIETLIDKLSKLPGIGKKSARRVAYYLLNASKEEVITLAQLISNIKEKMRFCSVCYNISESELCNICSNSQRDHSLICVVEQANDILIIEKTNEYKGLYHVLGGVISPLDNVGPEKLKIKELLDRTEKDIKEVIIAVNPSSEGDTTIQYLLKLLKPKVPKISILARGIPVGGDLEYSDQVTVARAITGRVDI
jgi:recombination protein RecR